jgi:transposase
MRTYDKAFKQAAVQKILGGQSVASVARELGVAQGVLHNWKKLRFATSSEWEHENYALRKRLKEVEMENEILKKAAAIFSRSG